MSTFEELNSDKALVCKREINSDQGNATVWMVLCSDGFLLDCGLSEARAVTLARMINKSRPELLSKEGLKHAFG